MHLESQLAAHHATDLRDRAESHRLATGARRPGELRTRLGWTLVEVGLRLTTPPRPAFAH
ncbi:hypothetical protein ACWC24_00010 [Streptomyces sp. NPDC001443]